MGSKKVEGSQLYGPQPPICEFYFSTKVFYRCESMPDWIWSFDNVITVEVDPGCGSGWVILSTDMNTGNSLN